MQGRRKVLGGGAAIGRRVEAAKRPSNFPRKARKIFRGLFFHDQEAAHVASHASLKVIACTVALNAVRDRMQSARSASRSDQKLSRNCILIVIICRQKLCKKYSFDQTA